MSSNVKDILRMFKNNNALLRNACLIIGILAAVRIFLLLTSRNVGRQYKTNEFIQLHGYSVETHHVTTFDGYVLTLFRIPKGKTNKTNGKVVLLQHALATNSIMWVLAGPEKSLAFKLADEGYDVWLGNSRETPYSRNHSVLGPHEYHKFWNFSWHEVGIYDLPAMIDYIEKITKNEGLFYIGASQGCTAMNVLMSTIPEYNEKIKAYIHLAPVVFLNYTSSLIFTLPGQMLPMIKKLADTTGGGEMFTEDRVIYQIIITFCFNDILFPLCLQGFYAIFGYSPYETNTTSIPFLLRHGVTGASYKQLTHYVQVRNSGHFRQFDYGPKENLIRYGNITPPDYDLSRLTPPGYAIYGSNDPMVELQHDFLRFYNSLRGNLQKFLVPVQMCNHVDLFFGISAPSIVNEKIVQILSEY